MITSCGFSLFLCPVVKQQIGLTSVTFSYRKSKWDNTLCKEKAGKSGKISIEIVLSPDISWLHAHFGIARKILTSVKYFIKKAMSLWELNKIEWNNTGKKKYLSLVKKNLNEKACIISKSLI